MLVCDYMVEQIDGDYAHLRRVDEPDGEPETGGKSAAPNGDHRGKQITL